MYSWKLKALLIASLAFNLAVLGAFAVVWTMNRPDTAVSPGDMSDSNGSVSARGENIARCIGLCESKSAHIHREMGRSCEEEERIKHILLEERNGLYGLINEAEPDTVAIMAKVERISSLQGKLEKMVVHKVLRSQAGLDPEERKRFLMLIGCKAGQGCGVSKDECPLTGSTGKEDE